MALGLVLAAGSGCTKDSATNSPEPAGPTDAAADPARPDPSAEPPAPSLTVHVESEANGNDGRPLYVLVRAVSLKDFVEDGYQDIADLVVEPDDTVLATLVVYPGTERSVTLDAPDAKTVAVYGLFTKATGSSWKRLFEASASIDVLAGRDRLLDEDDASSGSPTTGGGSGGTDEGAEPPPSGEDTSFDWFWIYGQ
ncbi:MAG: hypothetical protein AB1Z98_35835 [Nannocystaceae bacterium]